MRSKHLGTNAVCNRKGNDSPPCKPSAYATVTTALHHANAPIPKTLALGIPWNILLVSACPTLKGRKGHYCLHLLKKRDKKYCLEQRNQKPEIKV